MSMNVGGSKGGHTSDINMTPMIDILLVLLIIFMVVQVALQKGVSVQVPPIETAESQPDESQIVLEIRSGNQYFVNQQPIPSAQLESRLAEIFAPRPRKIIFVKGAEDITYGDVIYAVNAARAANIDVVGLIPRS